MILHEKRHGGFPTVPSIFGGCGEGLSDKLMGILPRSKKLKRQTMNLHGMEDLVLGSSLFPAATSNDSP
jgi:hypothetical protein